MKQENVLKYVFFLIDELSPVRIPNRFLDSEAGNLCAQSKNTVFELKFGFQKMKIFPIASPPQLYRQLYDLIFSLANKPPTRE